MNKDQYFSFLNPKNREEVEKFLKDIVTFSNEQQRFNACGLYAVGSSLRVQDPQDIDITLVGLDFKLLFDYGNIYLRNTEELIKRRIIVPANSPAGNISLTEDNTVIFGGKIYGFNTDEITDYNSISTYCSSTIRITNFIGDLIRHLERARGTKPEDLYLMDFNGNINPLAPYLTREHGPFLGIRRRFGPIDFVVHGENLLVTKWKEYQVNGELPFVKLYEWSKSGINSTWDRPITTNNLPYPNFIDSLGRRRSTITN